LKILWCSGVADAITTCSRLIPAIGVPWVIVLSAVK
jgi:hypothetical protein